ncbi:allantoate transport, partial [Fusarium acutatum]
MGTESEVNAAQAPVGTRDEAIAIVGEEQHSIDPIVAARAVRKIDLFLIPAMIIG